ncbi:GGDEF domain-containing protein [Leucobacter salsicius]|uniref:GGDEF domain-containing protein n=1 Tax=Leucobacter salsicius TaxID=664638 RepID=UPI0003476E71|nr:GGDEF domain-containing protein [Leucobacter salsicius]
MGLRRAVLRQNAHSWYLTVVQILLGLTLVIDLVFHRDMSNRWLLWLLLVVCVGGACLVFIWGAQLPVAVGLVGVAVFLTAQCYFLSLADDAQSVLSSVQEFPLVAFYLGWFIRPRWAIPLIGLGTLFFGAVMAFNPLFFPEGKLGPPIAVHGLLVLLFCFFAGSFLWHRNARAASTDLLTGVRTRAAFLSDLEARMRSRGANRVSVIAVDFDGLKQINDTQGHAAGDRVLQETTHQWRQLLRSEDIIGRLGGGEFVIALPGATLRSAREIDDRLRAASPFAWSSGVTVARTGESAEHLLNRADAELYKVKRKTGRRYVG